MAKKHKRSSSGRFVMLPYYILNSESFRAMSPKAVRIYIEILRRYNGQNNGEISLSCREAGKVAQCSAETAGKCLKELDVHGFIKPTRTGIFTVRLATTYRIRYKSALKMSAILSPIFLHFLAKQGNC